MKMQNVQIKFKHGQSVKKGVSLKDLLDPIVVKFNEVHIQTKLAFLKNTELKYSFWMDDKIIIFSSEDWNGTKYLKELLDNTGFNDTADFKTNKVSVEFKFEKVSRDFNFLFDQLTNDISVEMLGIRVPYNEYIFYNSLLTDGNKISVQSVSKLVASEVNDIEMALKEFHDVISENIYPKIHKLVCRC